MLPVSMPTMSLPSRLRIRKYTILPVRGEYYELVTPEKKSLIGRLVYPALPPHATGKGIHFSPRPNGRLFVGPNEMPIQTRRTTRRVKTPPGVFVEALQKFLPALEERDLAGPIPESVPVSDLQTDVKATSSSP